ncbi:PD-(D/E)XK nuclease family protein, partial [Candidatus Parvarchaeota archaeon]|nr:PD-(D/E)XK nuclease family protein [Candidatus Parvarchaeota archaeon]
MTQYLINKDRITFQEGGRFYFNEQTQQWVPSVTTILDYFPKSKQFLKWLQQNGTNSEDIRDEAGNDGSVVHQLTEWYDEGQEINLLNAQNEPKYSAKQWGLFLRYVDFMETIQPEILQSEFQVIGPDFAGTVDRLIRIDGKTYLLDIKTSKQVHQSHWCQVAAYACLFLNEYNANCSGVYIHGLAILHLQSQTRTKKDLQGKGWRLYLDED